jgi:hypothetical protein
MATLLTLPLELRLNIVDLLVHSASSQRPAFRTQNKSTSHPGRPGEQVVRISTQENSKRHPAFRLRSLLAPLTFTNKQLLHEVYHHICHIRLICLKSVRVCNKHSCNVECAVCRAYFVSWRKVRIAKDFVGLVKRVEIAMSEAGDR